jgi:hypothetical protein
LFRFLTDTSFPSLILTFHNIKAARLKHVHTYRYEDKHSKCKQPWGRNFLLKEIRCEILCCNMTPPPDSNTRLHTLTHMPMHACTNVHSASYEMYTQHNSSGALVPLLSLDFKFINVNIWCCLIDSIQQMTSVKTTDKCILDVSFCFLHIR